MPTCNGRRLIDCEPQDYAAATVQHLFQQVQTISAELQMHVRGDYSNSMLLMTPWESVHKGELAHQDYSSKGFPELTQRQGLNLSAEYFTKQHCIYSAGKQQCITCSEYRTLCPNLLCNACCEMEACGCLAAIWELNPAHRQNQTMPADAASDATCQHQNVMCPNGWSLIDYRENCWCDLCHGRVILNRGRCDENCGCQQWMEAPRELFPVIFAMRASKGSPPRYSPVQQGGDNDMDEGDLVQTQDEAFSPHGAESENSPLLPMRLSGRVERCANPDTGSVHVHRYENRIQRTVRQPQRHQQQTPHGWISPNMRPPLVTSPRLAIGYRKRDTKSAVVHLQRDCRYIRKEQVVEVRLKDQKICLVCSKGVAHSGKKNTPAARRTTFGNRSATNTTQSVEDITSQLQGMNLNLNGAVTLNASVTTTSPAQTANTLHALSSTGADVTVTLTTKPTAAATQKQTHTCIMCPIMMPVRGNYAEMLGTIVHIGDSDNPVSVVAAFDTLAEVSVVSADLVTKNTKRTPGVEDTPVWGVGQGSSPLIGEFGIPTRFRWGAQIQELNLRKDNGDFMQQLRGLKMVIGIPTLVALGAQIDLASRQVRLEALHLTLELEPVGSLVARLACKPMRALSLCGGGEFCYFALRDAGLTVEVWDCVELDKDARRLASTLVPQANHLLPHDITRINSELIKDGAYDLVILTSPCQPFSVLPNDPKGWDDPRSEPLLVGSRMIRDAIEAGVRFYFISEQTAVHRKLTNCANEQDEVIGAAVHGHKYQKINALGSGSPSSRLRRYCRVKREVSWNYCS